jgi:hypothetical protein
VAVVREFVVENFLVGDGEELKEDSSFLERVMHSRELRK